MKQILFVLLCTFLLASCGTGSTFSKRKHLPGHFWNKTEHFKKEKSAKIERKNQDDVAQNNDEKRSEINTNSTKKEEFSLTEEKKESQQPVSETDRISQDENPSLTDYSETSVPEESIDEPDEHNSTTASEKRSGMDGLAAFLIMLIAMIALFFIGIILLIIWLIINATGFIGAGMLILSLILIGVPFIFFLVLFFIGTSS
jgi:Flp pilus assembly protein TadB